MAGPNRWTRREVMEALDRRGRQSRQELYDQADAVRRKRLGDAVHLRGLVEFSNICGKNCLYCGIRAGNPNVARYRLDDEAILALAKERCVILAAHRLSTVLQADYVVVLEAGRVIEQGAPADLLAAGGAFARLVRAHEPAAEEQV